MRTSTILFPILASLFLGCGGRESETPVDSGPPQDVKYRVITNPQFGKPYLGKPVKTVGYFLTMPPAIGMMGKYKTDWTRLVFSEASPGDDGAYACQSGGGGNLAAMTPGGAGVVAPTSVGQEFLSAKTGSVYELVGVLREDKDITPPYPMYFFEVSTVKLLAACK